MNTFDVIVIGGGHAGIEAALASARLGKETCLMTLKIENIGKMPCNPSVGGPAKGIVVREIDALGGQMGKTADATALQFKMLNSAKGPGVRALRVQSDKLAYAKMMQDVCLHQEHLTVVETMVTRLIVEDHICKGVMDHHGVEYYSQATILTTGTYMAGVNMISDEVKPGGPDLEATTGDLSQCLRDLGLKTFRLKTGTPPRVLTSSIDFSQTHLEPGNQEFLHFSQMTKPQDVRSYEQQVPCYLTYTTEKTHEIIQAHLQESSMYSGVVKGVGPRYCPSIEDKIVRFHDKPRHLLFLEPESLQLDTTYVQGFSTSLPRHVQEEMLKTLPGFQNAIIKKYAYAIEYDAIDPIQTKPSMENKLIENLFTAGQVNGTSGYEEAAGQGLMAGINAVMKIDQKEPLVLSRQEAYIGVMIDDLTTKGTLEPYRLLTSRAEFRLLLRHDNASDRLIEKGYAIGLVKKEQYDLYQQEKQEKQRIKDILGQHIFRYDDPIVADYLEQQGYPQAEQLGYRGIELLKRPNITTKALLALLNQQVDEELAQQIDIEIKYEGYIEKAKREAKKLLAMDHLTIPENLDYAMVDNLSLEGRQKLALYRPATIGQASRISGVNPADIAVLVMTLKKEKTS